METRRRIEAALLGDAPRRFEGRVACAERTPGGWAERTHGELALRVEGTASALRELGVRAGERVGILGDSGTPWVEALLATLHCGAVAVPLDTKWNAAGLERVARSLRPRCVIACGAGHRARAAEARFERVVAVEELERRERASAFAPHAWQAEECALIVMTSGTTGEPRGVRLPWRSLRHQIERLGDAMAIDENDVFVSILPPAHLLGLVCGVLTPLARGSELVFAASLLPHEVAQIARERRATRMLVVPMFLALLEKELRGRGAREAFGPQFQAFHCGGAALDPALARALERDGVDVLVGYGMTETGPVIATNTRGAKRPQSVGRPLEGVEVRVDAGELLTRGPHVMLGYQGGSADEAPLGGDGWLRTGDLGSVDAEGFVFITGRSKELIVLASGCKVQPEEVEQVFAASPLLREVCVLGRAAHGNERIELVVVPSDQAIARARDDVSRLESELQAEVERLQRALAGFQRPEHVHVVRDPLPRTASGKISRREVARRLDERKVAEA